MKRLKKGGDKIFKSAQLHLGEKFKKSPASKSSLDLTHACVLIAR